MDWDLEEITSKWQNAWWEAKLHEAERDDKPSYFLHFAYPGISGYLHVGHMRGFTYSDVFTRYKRMKGYNVLFPAGFHASGIPAVAFAKDVERGDKTQYLLDNGYDEAADGPIANLKDPQKVVDYFARVYTYDYWKKFGFLIDERRNATTIDDGYKAFIQWQFRKLNSKGWLVQKPHYAPYCPVAGPIAVDKSETDINQGGNAEVQEFVALRFALDGDWVLPCATLRPETVYGVTNIWVHQDTTYELVRVWQDGAVADSDPSEIWVVSSQGRRKLLWQMERAEPLDEQVQGADLVGKTATAPLTGRSVPIVAGKFVDPMIATGIVMSVPAHAPFDWAAYTDAGLLETLGEPPQIVTIEGYTDLPARQACNQFGVKSQLDAEPLQEATEQVYADEFNKGVLNDQCGDFAGKRIKQVKDDIRAAFLAADHGRLIRQFSEVVISRAGEVADIRRIPDQDFIHYSDKAWTAAAKAHTDHMAIYPQRYKDDIHNVMDWFGDRACVRRGSWLGTEFPFKKDWIVEPIADSTFYPWYYVVSLYVNDGRLAVSELTDAFFDYIYNGAGQPASPLWQQIRDDVQYWGPVDINLGGKEHQTVHFPVYIMNMVGLMEDPALWPKGIFVNWWVTQQAGAKISKSKGGAEPIPGAAKKYGVDPMRLYYCHVGSPHVDIEWDPDLVLTYRNHVLRVARVAVEALEVRGAAGPMDGWLESRTNQLLGAAGSALEQYDLRTAATELVYSMPDAIRWYRRRGGNNGALLAKTLQQWALALCPILPHTAEEIYALAGGEGLCSAGTYPEPSKPAPANLAVEEHVKVVLEDIQTIQRLAEGEAHIVHLFTTPAWKTTVLQTAVRMADGNRLPVGEFMQEIMQDPAMRAIGKPVQAYCGKMAQALSQMPSYQRDLLAVDEFTLLQGAADFLGSETGLAVHVHRADDDNAPQSPKRAVAAPFKVGIQLDH